MPILSLFITAASPVLVTFVLAGVGALLAKKVYTSAHAYSPATAGLWSTQPIPVYFILQGILNSTGTTVLAALCFNVFTPALIFSTLGGSLTVDSIHHLWPLLVNMSASILVGFALGYLAAAVFKTPAEYRNIVVAAIAFGNVGNLPLVFDQALCHDTQAVFYQELGVACNTLGVAYTAFNLCVATLFQFTVAIQMLRPPTNACGKNPHYVDGADGDLDPTTADGLLQQTNSSKRRLPLDNVNQPAHVIELQGMSHPRPSLYEQPGQHQVHVDSDTIVEDDGTLLEASSLTPSKPHGSNKTLSITGILSYLREVDWHAAFPPPIQATIAGIAVGCIPALRSLMFGPNPPLRVLSEALRLLGDGLIPGAIPLLGAVLYRQVYTQRQLVHKIEPRAAT